MLKKFKIATIIYLEVLLLSFVPLLWILLANYTKYRFSVDNLIDAVFIIGIITSIVVRSNHVRHFGLALLFLLLTSFASALGFNSLTFIFSALVLSFLVLGALNQILFGRNK